MLCTVCVLTHFLFKHPCEVWTIIIPIFIDEETEVQQGFCGCLSRSHSLGRVHNSRTSSMNPFCSVLGRAPWGLSFSSGSPGVEIGRGELLTGVLLEQNNHNVSLFEETPSLDSKNVQ